MNYPSVITPEHSPGPNANALTKWLQKIFGGSFHVTRGYSVGHDGIDLGAKEGTPIRAIKSGVVSYARDARLQVDKGRSGWAIGGGNVVNIDIGGKLTTQYAHLQSFTVNEGQLVNAGDIIGYVGRTGGLTSSGIPGGPGSQFVGSHLHFGLWDKNINKQINPQTFFENIGDTSGGGPSSSSPSLAQWQEKLKSIGIPFDPSHIFTHDEAVAIVQQLYKIDVTSSMGQSILKSFEGQSVAASLAPSGGLNLNPLDAVGTALTAVGTQIADTITWIGFILLGIVFIFGGIYLLRPTEGSA